MKAGREGNEEEGRKTIEGERDGRLKEVREGEDR